MILLTESLLLIFILYFLLPHLEVSSVILDLQFFIFSFDNSYFSPHK